MFCYGITATPTIRTLNAHSKTLAIVAEIFAHVESDLLPSYQESSLARPQICMAEILGTSTLIAIAPMPDGMVGRAAIMYVTVVDFHPEEKIVSNRVDD